MLFLLSCRVINGKFVCWIVVLLEFDLEFTTPKSKKSLDLTEFIFDLVTGVTDPPLNDYLPDEHLFTILLDHPWYGDIII
jgi:hypothetical protein